MKFFIFLVVLIVHANLIATFKLEIYNKQRAEFCSTDVYKHFCTRDMIKLSENYSKSVQNKIQALKRRRKELQRQQMLMNTIRKHFLDRYF